MTLGDLETVARYAIPLLVIVMNDRAYGAERHFLDLTDQPHRHSQFPDIDFAGVAGSLGLEAATVWTPDELEALTPRLRAPLEQPLLLDCKIDPALRAGWLEEL
jgi:thiamine pyrophosphate-dependent acetolactate synthase large subunit-like protein